MIYLFYKKKKNLENKEIIIIVILKWKLTVGDEVLNVNGHSQWVV